MSLQLSEKAWNVILLLIGVLLLPSIACYCLILATAIGWSSRPIPSFWKLPQYLALVMALLLPWIYWFLFLLARKRKWGRRTLLAIGLLSLLWLPMLAIADQLGLTY